jgi:hypothetical protein
MDARALRELELLPVARLYGLADVQPAAAAPAAVAPSPLAEAPLAAWVAGNAPWLFVAEVADAQAGRLLGAMMAAVGCEPGRQVEVRAETPLDALGARVIVALGERAAQRATPGAAVPVVVTRGLAELLAQPGDKAIAWKDLLRARATLAGHTP